MQGGCYVTCFFFLSFMYPLWSPLLLHACVHDQPKAPSPLPHEWPYKGTVSLLANQYPRTARQPPSPLSNPSGPACALSGLICRRGGIAFLCTPSATCWWLYTLRRSSVIFQMSDRGRVRCPRGEKMVAALQARGVGALLECIAKWRSGEGTVSSDGRW